LGAQRFALWKKIRGVDLKVVVIAIPCAVTICFMAIVFNLNMNFYKTPLMQQKQITANIRNPCDDIIDFWDSNTTENKSLPFMSINEYLYLQYCFVTGYED